MDWAVVDGLRRMRNLRGIVVTVPHKEAIALTKGRTTMKVEAAKCPDFLAKFEKVWASNIARNIGMYAGAPGAGVYRWRVGVIRIVGDNPGQDWELASGLAEPRSFFWREKADGGSDNGVPPRPT